MSMVNLQKYDAITLDLVMQCSFLAREDATLWLHVFSVSFHTFGNTNGNLLYNNAALRGCSRDGKDIVHQ